MKQCIECGTLFKTYCNINGKHKNLKNRRKCLKCSPYKELSISENITINCKNCNKKITKKKYQIKENKNYFCSSSCSCSFNNSINNHPKRKLTKKCKNCNKLIRSSKTYCSDCFLIKNPMKNKCLSHYQKKIGANRYSSIRDHARKITSKRIQECFICGYSTHVETCHIKEIYRFPLDTTIEEINHPDNLVLLCKNHHWEMDHGIFCLNILMGPAGLEPATERL